jgi:hypothetical protein
VDTNHGPIQIHPDGHHLRHSDGTPFLYLADTFWWGPSRLDQGSFDFYLEDRRSKGFTVIQIMAIQLFYTEFNPTKFYGHRPFLNGNPAIANPEIHSNRRQNVNYYREFEDFLQSMRSKSSRRASDSDSPVGFATAASLDPR